MEISVKFAAKTQPYPLYLIVTINPSFISISRSKEPARGRAFKFLYRSLLATFLPAVKGFISKKSLFVNIYLIIGIRHRKHVFEVVMVHIMS